MINTKCNDWCRFITEVSFSEAAAETTAAHCVQILVFSVSGCLTRSDDMQRGR